MQTKPARYTYPPASPTLSRILLSVELMEYDEPSLVASEAQEFGATDSSTCASSRPIPVPAQILAFAVSPHAVVLFTFQVGSRS
jgi:hypothetical protein